MDHSRNSFFKTSHPKDSDYSKKDCLIHRDLHSRNYFLNNAHPKLTLLLKDIELSKKNHSLTAHFNAISWESLGEYFSYGIQILWENPNFQDP